MNVLVIGSGGREHALCWKLAQSPLLKKLYCAPGNAGIASVAKCVVLNISDHPAIIEFCHNQKISLVVIGPEVPLVAGLADVLATAGIAAFGPSAKAAQLEASKIYTKDLCAEYDIPTAAFQRFNNAPKAKAYARGQSMPLVVKADGLAAGKGVIIAETIVEACNAIDDCFEGEFGEAGNLVLIEEYLEGEEASMFFLCDGKSALPFGTAQDHKRVGEGDTGPNTGGMGAYSPAPVMSEDVVAQTISRIIEPTLKAMAARGAPFSGVLYAGLMIDSDGPKLIEYNVRFGDPECQVLMIRLESDLLPLLLAAANGELAGQRISWSNGSAMCVVYATNGYPGTYQKGTAIGGLEAIDSDEATVFHAGTAMENGRLVAIGGRVLNITASGENIAMAKERCYRAIGKINWPDGFYRRDIGWRAIG